MSSVLYDPPGPQARKRALVGSIVGGAAVLGLLAWAAVRLAGGGVFEAERWAIFVEEPDVWLFLGQGLLSTLRAAAQAAVLAAVLGVLFAMLRISSRAYLRVPAGIVIELFRGLPVVLMMFFGVIALGLQIFDGVVFGLTVYNAAIIAEILRAGIASLPKGQSEAGAAIGLRRWQIVATILLPQAVRRMLPALISQFVVLLKDTSLGYIVGYGELLFSADNLQNYYGSDTMIPVFTVAATIYIAINLTLSRLAVWIERRGTSRAAGGVVHTDAVQTADAVTADATVDRRGGDRSDGRG